MRVMSATLKNNVKLHILHLAAAVNATAERILF